MAEIKNFDKFCIKAGYVREEDLTRRFKIRLCKDRTITFTEGKTKPFNDVAIAVISVDTRREAEQLITLCGKQQYESHPLMPGKPWFKFMPDMEYGDLEFSDLPRLAGILRERYANIRRGYNKAA